jgi:hypothetical protein
MTTAVTAGSEWAYFESSRAQPIRVLVLRPGTISRVRHQVRFLGDEWEAHEEWVIPARLKYPWAELAARQAAAAALQDLLGRGSRGFGEDLAGEHLIDAFLKPMLRARGKSGQHGLYDVLDLAALSSASGVDEVDIERDGYDFDGVLTVAWPTAEALLVATAKANAEVVLAYVRSEEKRGVWEASFGVREGKGKRATYRTPEVCQWVFKDVTRPMLDALT